MRKRYIALNVALALGLAGLAWKAKVEQDEAAAQRRETVRFAIKPVPASPLAPSPQPDPAVPSKYSDVAQKNLFSKDRNPQVVIEPPKPPDTPKPMPKLPVVYGVMGLPSGVKAMMADGSGGSASVVKTGDSVGEFKVLALDTRNVTFDWNGKQITKPIEDLIDRTSGPAGSAPPNAPNVAASPAVAPAAIAPAPERTSTPQQKPDPGRGVDIGSGSGPSVKACTPGDNTPAGTVVDGYKKISEPTPFGPACRWIKQ